ncbi:MAG: DNA-processing protein DprA [Deltaproteobacteria bacterium]|nr:DNA-processing protein DprA [Deltaproteobacteria bacterium]
MESKELLYLLALSRVRGISISTLRKIIRDEALTALNTKDNFDLFNILERPVKLRTKGGRENPLNESSPLELITKDDLGWAEKEILKSKKLGAQVFTIGDLNYPRLLLESPTPPLLIYTLGASNGLCTELSPTVAIIGTRQATEYGLSMARIIAKELAEAGITIVSGMARGCDSAAHRGALLGGGYTIAVLGSGIDVVYPPENKKLYAEIAEKGTVISEFPIGTSPLAYNFPTRNRIISALSLGVFVVEAPLKSGAMMTVTHATECGKEVFALPGRATSQYSTGTNKLLKDGAHFVTEARDIIEPLALQISRSIDFSANNSLANQGNTKQKQEQITLALKTKKQRPLRRKSGTILDDFIDDNPIHIDEIASKAELPIEKVSALLLEMELGGFIEQMPGKHFIRKP